MKLTKKLEAEVLRMYKAYWEAYLNGDMKTFASMLADDITIFGTAVSEVFNNKKETLRFYKATADQLVGKAQFRNRQIRMNLINDNVLLSEECDFYFLLEQKWTFYGHARVSAILKKTNKGWKLAHQHASFPDTRAEEGEQVAAEKIKEENLQLRDAVKRRTIELEEKNRELEVESAVERVRAKALAMHKSEEISDVANVLRTELGSLNIPGIAAATIILQQENNKIRLWDITSVVELEDGFHFAMDFLFDLKGTKPSDWIRKIWNSKEKYFVYKQDKKSFKRTLEWTSKYDPEFAKNARQFLETNKIKNSWHPVVPLSHGKLSLDLLQEPIAEVESILSKMAAAFDLAYKRFLDLKKAEAQAREAKIETALERIRARALAMHSSDELMEVAKVLREQLSLLGQPDLETSVIHLYEEDPDHILSWRAFRSGTNKGSEITYGYIAIPKNSCEFVREWLTNYYSNLIEYTIEISGTKQKEWYDVLFKLAPDVINAMRQNKTIHEKRYHQFSKFSGGALLMVSKQQPSEESIYLQRRAALVFELAYRRFLDLKNAEAQAREAQIEAALEKVRSRSLAMHKSEEMQGVVDEVFMRLKELQVKLDTANILIFNEGSENLEAWTASSQSSFSTRFLVSVTSAPHFSLVINAMKNGQELVTNKYNFKEKNKWFNYLFKYTDYKYIPEDRKQFILNSPCFTVSVGLSKNICIQLNSYSREAFTENENNILVRFTKVFEQSYTRFLDLQKAEAQAREAQIEAALERVRAKTMAMHNSQDVTSATETLFEQLKKLGIDNLRCGIANIYHNGTFDVFGVTHLTSDNTMSGFGFFGMDELPVWKRWFKSWKNKEEVFIAYIAGQEKEEYFKNINDHLNYLPQKIIDFPDSFFQAYYFGQGSLWVYSLTQHTEPEKEIMKRFASVFELTFRRYQDLKKAEAQAREAKIEAALEKVRSRTMGMQRSDELQDAAMLLFQQVESLGVPSFACGFNIWDEDKKEATAWMAGKDRLQPPFKTSSSDDVFLRIYEAAQRDEPLFVEEQGGEELKAHYKYMASIPVFKEVMDKMKESGLSVPTFQIVHCAFFSQGYLMFISFEPVSYAYDIFKRFAKVFEQTYTRFLDLQKAEAQASEAQIEAALERVRSRSMAMHHSNDLQDVIRVLSDQLLVLELKFDTASFAKIHSDGSWDLWISTPDQPYPAQIHVPYFDHPIFREIKEADEKRENFFERNYTLEEKNSFFKYFFENTAAKNIPEARKQYVLKSKGFARSVFLLKNIWLSVANYDGIPFSDDENAMLQRFANVFEQSYTRFLDLQKAEAQAREAQIQLALERVRARTMAMHRSEELAETAQVMFHQLQELGGIPDRIAIGVVDEEEGMVKYWTTDQSGKQVDRLFKARLNERTVLSKTYQAWKDQKRSLVVDLHGDDVIEWVKFAREEMGVEVKDDLIKDRRVHTFTFFSHGWILVTTHEPQSPETIQILERFASVFNLTYRRFLDLEKAEAQANEARIEISLERIRARALAMHKSDELLEVAVVMREQMALLGQPDLEASVVHLYEEDPDHILSWRAFRMEHGSGKKIVLGHMSLPKDSCEFVRECLEKFHSDLQEYMIDLSGTKQDELYDVMARLAPDVIDSLRQMNSLHEKRYYWFSKFSGGALLMVSKQEPAAEAIYLQKRAAIVFDLAYRRFLDLQKAEAQAREAQIEAALERVRSRAMAMHKTDELLDAADLVYKELSALGITSMNVSYAFVDEEEKSGSYYSVNPVDGKTMPYPFVFPHTETEVMRSLLSSWKKQEPLNVIELDEEATLKHQTYIGEHILQLIKKNNIDIPFSVEAFLNVSPKTAVIYSFNFAQGYLFVIGEERLTKEQEQMLLRFTKVFELAYRRFLDLKQAEAQTREAQIELALERVRARTMAMHKSDELAEAAQVMFHQLQELGGIPDRMAIGVADEEAGIVNFWATDQSGSHIDKKIKARLDERTVIAKAYQAWKDQKKSLVVDLQGNDVSEWLRFVREEMGVAVNEEFIKDRRVHHLAFYSHGWIKVTSHEPPSTETIQILERFASVFNLTYRRFLDLRKAEAQAREAQIEAGLERVRARAMAMQTSEELNELIGTVFAELTKLDLVLTRSVIQIYEGNEKGTRWWMANSEAPSMPANFFIKYTDLPFFNAFLKGWNDRSLKWQYILEGENKIKTDDYLFTKTELSGLPDFVIAGMKAAHRIHLNASFNSFGNLTLASLEPLSDEHFDILLRFAKVFDLTYTRFNDLQKAEAQAKEARIEIALERIRARALAMHKSDELMEVAKVLREQMALLGQPELEASVVHLYEADPDYVHSYRAVSIGTEANTKLTYGHMFVAKNSCEFVREWLANFYSDSKEYTIEISGAKQDEWYAILSKLAPEVVNSMRQRNSLHEKRYYRFSKFSGGALLMVSTQEPSVEVAYLQKRAAAVFDLAYRRFSDLQKAEAQARESELELALERVRAKSMSMRSSDELGDLVGIVFKELTRIGFPVNACIIMTYDEKTNDSTWWIANMDGVSTPVGLFVPNHSNEPYVAYLNEWKKQTTKWRYNLRGDEKKKWDQYIFKNSELATLPDVVQKGMQSAEDVHLNVCFNKYASITFGSFDPMSEKDFDTVHRFAKVFEQSYTRFLDLQKAEAQAREAQIEAALEKIRSRSLAMHKSDELQEVVNTVFEKLQDLNVEMDSCNIAIFKEGTRDYDYWIASPVQNRSAVFHVPYMDLYLTKDLVNARENGEDFFCKSYSFEEKNKWFDYAYEHSDFKFLTEERKKFIAGGKALSCSIAFSKNTGVQINRFSGNLPSEGEIDILKRFSKVFEQAYIRFLDLEKAEAQAREAQIEAALEKVRSRSLAMHKSDELQEVVNTVFERLQDLNIEMDSCNIAIFKQGTRDYDYWIASPYQKRSASFHMPYIDLSLTKDLIAARESGVDFSSRAYSFEEKKEWFDYAFKNTDFRFLNEDRKEFILNTPAIMVAIAFSKHTGVQVNRYNSKLLTEGEAEILKRFSKVFEQAYIRFLDLEKAEAQAREAQIEASLERVRSKTMAMHNSHDVGETVSVMFDELVKLGIQTLRCGVGIFYEGYQMELWTAKPHETGKIELFVGHLDMKLHPLLTGGYEAWKAKRDRFSYELKDDDLIAYFNVINNYSGYQAKYDIAALPSRIFHEEFNFNEGCLFSFSLDQLSAESSQIFKRFAGVFGQTYRRYLDLQKAEAQAREAKIEASLERVRAKAMAMHKSEDLNAAVAVVFEELDKLDLGVLRCGISILDKEKRTGDIWVTSITDQGSAVQVSGDESFDIHPLLQGAFEAWLRKEDFSYLLEGDDLTQYYKAMGAANFQLPESQILTSETEFRKQYCYATPYGAGGLFAFRETEFPQEAKTVMKRFASVFDLTYKRFLDLQKAEANAREARIEAALERVRSRTMAMHKSDELSETAVVLFKQLSELGNDPDRFSIGIIDEEANIMNVYATDQEGSQVNIRFKARLDEKTTIERMYRGWKSKLKSDVIHLHGKSLDDWIKYLRDELGMAINVEHFKGQRFHNVAYFSQGWLNFTTVEPASPETISVLERFAAVFNLTYRRFLDLQKAEANAKEAQIEAGLERVRARTMAMHSSDDVSAATATMFTELEKLGIENFRGGITNILPNRTQDVWSVNHFAEGKVLKAVGAFSIDAHPFWQLMFQEWEAKKDFTYYFLTGPEKEDYLRILNTTQGYLQQPIQQFPDVHFQVYYFNEGAVWTNSLQPHTENEKQVMKRFTSVFSLTFRRYQDLKKAEAQAREATIEAALERVRGKAMAMHSSKDLATTIGVFYHELEGLNLTPRRCGVGLIDKETHKAEISTMNATTDGQGIELVGVLDMGSHPVLENVYNNWLTKTEYHPVLRGDEIGEYYRVVRPNLPFTHYPDDVIQYGYFFFFDEGGVYAWTEKELNEEELKIYRRFTSVLSLTYKRYKDLKDAEQRAQNAIKDAALDRIRADIASMRTVGDLDRITPLIWNELTTLNIPFIRCGVFIMDETQRIIHTYLSTPEGKAIAAFHLPYDTPGNFSDMLHHWYSKKIYISHWNETDFIDIAETLVKQGAIANKEQYLNSLPKGGFYLHFLPFLQGMLYAGNTDQLNEEQIEMIQHVADAFSTAYARYEDFNKLEAAKQQVENTLTDLKQAQQQLVQSEKMASLGELTAGIAHEIQNPLNFVNNFSDVSNELLEEMKNELEKGNKEDAIAIVEDVKQNLEKILHHGKRADAIVKGMLQHSRTSSGQKEMIDINILADEYLRLAYHGLRAKDKSFNAKFETHFDNNIGKVNVIPQEIGRVILNLINNAFYTVSEKKKQSAFGGYEPTVTVTTLKDNGRVEIKVKDNGNGIPQKVLDKIFQPFFTTKPTGQGTGLGLSLAYDIVTKGHGGELKVETREGEGSEFVIQLPSN